MPSPVKTNSQGLDNLQQDHPNLTVSWVDSIDSTQQSVQANSILIAEQQLAGVGRRGNRWLTPSGQAICFSYRFTLNAQTNQMSGYALMVAVSIIQVIKAFDGAAGSTTKAQLKWPNDLYFDQQKFGGILIHVKPMNPGAAGPKQLDVTVGIGINWSLSKEQLQSVDQPVCNIPLCDKPPRADFINRLIKQLNHNNPQFLAHGLSPFLQLWQQHDYLVNKPVCVTQDTGIVEGLYHGIDEQGQLLIAINGMIKTYSAGEVSVRMIKPET
ncbi:biotin--[acetyl-CoA-carboxylase] ligase [Marinicella litoralis]|uniref:biotin--[biotin carboxyl-carrier protein] ligase n=1 Tax=Marinicella litoralis TaxID=644220 RepID=A0A4R6Y390_9GAMM|nr:biotin--[acetyl-CoA-carboxylase] ligase [Marinicella litoralis]TDR23508.1 BirA family biotin operon repressor/biotin-[acetyl-CoA-carboxylase] ligase [Marinicella litoralis]